MDLQVHESGKFNPTHPYPGQAFLGFSAALAPKLHPSNRQEENTEQVKAAQESS